MKTQTDITEVIGKFQKYNLPEDRYCSFDYCYNYFYTNSGIDLTKDIEKSCLVLGFYLASWGMLRASSYLLKRSAKHFEPLIKYFSRLDKNVWSIDVESYDESNIQKILAIYDDIKKELGIGKRADLTLVTKVMLGVFGFVPAFDQYFIATFRELFAGDCAFRSLNMKSLLCIKEFYESHKSIIDEFSDKIATVDFLTGKPTHIRYPRAKIIDMYGFSKKAGRQL